MEEDRVDVLREYTIKLYHKPDLISLCVIKFINVFLRKKFKYVCVCVPFFYM